MTLTLTVGPATDYLYGLAQDACTALDVTVNGQTVAAVAVDGEPRDEEFAMFVVGVESPDTAGSGRWTGAAPILGGASASEDYTIPCYIDVRLFVDDLKTVRDIACSLFDTFWNALMADRSLGGNLVGGGAVIGDVNPSTNRVGTTGEPGQRYFLGFSVRCTDLQLG